MHIVLVKSLSTFMIINFEKLSWINFVFVHFAAILESYV